MAVLSVLVGCPISPSSPCLHISPAVLLHTSAHTINRKRGWMREGAKPRGRAHPAGKKGKHPHCLHLPNLPQTLSKVHFAQPNDPRQEKPHEKSIKIMAVTNDPHQHRPTYDTHFSVLPSQSNFSLWMPITRRESDCLLIMRRKGGLSKCQDAFLFIELCCQPSIPAVLPAPLRPPPTDRRWKIARSSCNPSSIHSPGFPRVY